MLDVRPLPWLGLAGLALTSMLCDAGAPTTRRPDGDANVISGQIAPASAPASPNITIDASQTYQRIDGFGLNANSGGWRDSALIPALDTLIDTMGARVWRVIVESTSGWETTNDDADPFTFNWSYYDAIYAAPKFESLWSILNYLNQRGALGLHLSVMGCLPDWMGRCEIRAGSEDEFVEMVAALLSFARDRRGVRLDSVSPLNEPDLGDPEGPLVGPDQYRLVMGKLAARLEALGLGDVSLLGPETAGVTTGVRDYMGGILADPSLMATVRRFALHDYAGNTGGAGKAIAGSAYPDRAFWVTEFAGPCGPCDTGPPGADDWALATGMMARLFSFLDQGASSALVYDAYDSFYEHHASDAHWGMLSYDGSKGVYTPRRSLYAAAQLFRFVEPGMWRIGVSTALLGVRVHSFYDGASGKLAIVGHNTTTSGHTLRGELKNTSAPVDHFQLYQTSQTRNLARESDVAVTNGSFVVFVPGGTIFTLFHPGHGSPTG